ncbi:hypothetical protein JT358_16605 [Micrococcales bacterium 31B]|nr:hypothetical protein [Micrococcales bacterium 31B]
MSLISTRPEPTLAIAHRGLCSDTVVENTLESIAAAIHAGADLVEVDLQICMSGEMFLLHDDTLERIWGLDAHALFTPWETISALRTATGQRIPTLDEALDLVADSPARLLLDMTEGWPAASAARRVLERGLGHKVAWCGTTAALAAVRQADPTADVFLAWQDSSVPEPLFVEPYGAKRLNMAYPLVTPEFIRGARALGYGVVAWTVDDVDLMCDLVAAGVDGITTNHVEDLVDVIAATGTERPRDDDGFTRGGLTLHELVECLDVAQGLGRWACAEVRTHPAPSFHTKRDAADFVTELDNSIELRVRETVLSNFPDHEFCGEETGVTERAGASDKYTWYLDPIDGTANLRFGLPWSAFSLAMARGLEPLVAVVVQVWTGETFSAISGRGATLNGRPLGKKAVTPTMSQIDIDIKMERSTLIGTAVLTEWANQHPWPGQVDLVEHLADRDCTVRVMGSETLALTSVAAGRAAAAVIRDFNPIDHLAGALIVQEAGGVILTEAGEHDPFPEGGFLAIDPEQRVKDELYDLWRECIVRAETRSSRFDDWKRPGR